MNQFDTDWIGVLVNTEGPLVVDEVGEPVDTAVRRPASDVRLHVDRGVLEHSSL